MAFLFLLLPSLLAAGLAGLVRPYRAATGWINATLSIVSLGAAIVFAGKAARGDAVPVFGPGELLRADGLSALLMVCVAAVASLVLFLSPGFGREAKYSPSQLRRYQLFINLFIFSMLFAVSANNVGVMWIAIEATTIFSALLIPLPGAKSSVEASWKYILICSVGIALAFAGTVLGYFDFVSLSGPAENALNWPVLLSHAPALHPEVMKLAFVFLLVGYGTKAGIAPMHTWKPDAYDEAPAPLSAMMSAVLLAVAIYAILRWKTVVDATLGSGYTNKLFIALGLLSLTIASFSIVLSRNYKRMLAYSSIEHTGLMCLGLALGKLGVFAALLHLVNHTAAKSMTFLLAGRVFHRYGAAQIKDVSGLLKTMPGTARMLAVGVLAIIGLPPFGLFISEFTLMQAGFRAGHPWVMGAALALLLVAFVAIISHLNRMLYGPPPEGVAVGEKNVWPLVLMSLNVAALVTLGLAMPEPFKNLLNQIAGIVSR
ncbi:MAG TPA: proton-conducting transporter membrane subunit [Blastocatellia bacterium]|nr:proton-conducting transporter membrane subunit [Blastocatellia bacterium]